MDIARLKGTIADAGLLQPILVRQTERGYMVIDGARRLQALKELNVQELIIGRDVIVEESETEADETFKQLIANIQREDVNDIELGHALVTLKERYGYQYKEIAEIIGKTSHYVAAKVGLAKRLALDVQEQVVKDWEAAKYIQNTLSCSDDDLIDPYVMNVNVIEDIARLPAGIQKAAYEAIKEKEMDKNEALRYLRSVKKNAEVLEIADDVKGLMEACSDVQDDTQQFQEKEFSKYLKKINRDVEKLLVTIKAGHMIDREKAVPILESLIERLNLLYAEVTEDIEDSRVTV